MDAPVPIKRIVGTGEEGSKEHDRFSRKRRKNEDEDSQPEEEKKDQWSISGNEAFTVIGCVRFFDTNEGERETCVLVADTLIVGLKEDPEWKLLKKRMEGCSTEQLADFCDDFISYYKSGKKVLAIETSDCRVLAAFSGYQEPREELEKILNGREIRRPRPISLSDLLEDVDYSIRKTEALALEARSELGAEAVQSYFETKGLSQCLIVVSPKNLTPSSLSAHPSTSSAPSFPPSSAQRVKDDSFFGTISETVSAVKSAVKKMRGEKVLQIDEFQRKRQEILKKMPPRHSRDQINTPDHMAIFTVRPDYSRPNGLHLTEIEGRVYTVGVNASQFRLPMDFVIDVPKLPMRAVLNAIQRGLEHAFSVQQGSRTLLINNCFAGFAVTANSETSVETESDHLNNKFRWYAQLLQWTERCLGWIPRPLLRLTYAMQPSKRPPDFILPAFYIIGEEEMALMWEKSSGLEEETLPEK